MRPSPSTRPRWLPQTCVAVALAAGVSGCGDNPDADASSPTPQSAATDAADPGAGSDASSAGSYATITIDETTYEATGVFTCLTLGGAINAELISDDDLVRIGVSLPPLDAAPGEWPAPSVYLRDDTDPNDQLHLESGSETAAAFEGYADVAVVEDFTIDGSTGTGSATFIDPGMAMAGTAEPIQGTFTVGCE
jgi:hypothetical protein